MSALRYVIVSLISLLVLTCSKEVPESTMDVVVVAEVDDQVISETSFQRAYLPLLLYGDKFDSEKNREDVVNFLVGQKLLAQVARTHDLDTLSLVQRSIERVERKALTRQLYQEWVRKQMSEPTEDELREGFQRGKKSLFVRHLFAETEAEIKSYAERLKQDNENFYTLAQDVFSDTTLSRNGGALGWVTFGDLDETLEDTLYALQQGQISEPVRSQYGWHILSQDDSREELFITEEDFQKNKQLIRNKIIERREQVLGKRVLNEFMGGVDIQFERDMTQQVWPIVLAHLNPDDIQQGVAPEFGNLERQLAPLQDEVLLFANGEPWTVSQILARMPELERSLLYGNLYAAASNILRDEMLVREARRLHLDQKPAVVEEVRDAEEKALADVYVMGIADTLTFTEGQLQNYFESNQLSRYHAPDSLEVEYYSFSDSLTAAQALYKLRGGLITTDPADTKIWISGSTPVIYSLARTLSVGTMAGPVLYQNKWTLVKLISRKRFPLKFTDIKDRVRADMDRERFNATRNILINDLRPDHSIRIDYDMLNH